MEEIPGAGTLVPSAIYEEEGPGLHSMRWKSLVVRVRDTGHEDRAEVIDGKDRDEDNQVDVLFSLKEKLN